MKNLVWSNGGKTKLNKKTKQIITIIIAIGIFVFSAYIPEIKAAKSNKESVAIANSNKDVYNKIMSNEKDNVYPKLFVTIGDSISSRDKQTYGRQNGEKNKGYQQFIKEGLGMDGYINLGISGATIARGTEYLRGLSKIAMDYTFDNIEFIIVQAGTNDFALSVPLGTTEELYKEEPDRYTFYGGYTGLIKDLKRNNEGVDIYLFTPTQRNCKAFNDNCTNEAGINIVQYVEAIKDVGKHFGVKVIDMYGVKNISGENIAKYTVDGLHLNDDGYRIIANKFIKEFSQK